MTISPKAQEMIKFWEDSRNIPFKGSLIDFKNIDDTNTPCMCAQGQTLFKNGYTVEELMNMEQSKADKETARILGISNSHSRLLRIINDDEEGAPQDVLSNPQKYLGPNYKAVLDFWWKLDKLTEEQLKTIEDYYFDFYIKKRSEWNKAVSVAWKASEKTIGRIFTLNSAYASQDVYGYCAAYYVSIELIGGVEDKVFLPMFDNL